MRSGLKPGSLAISTGDTHIYKDHLEQVSEQMSRECLASPLLLIDEKVKTKNIEDITIDDFEMIGYLPHSAIKANMSA
jgi:thymidylate synthase